MSAPLSPERLAEIAAQAEAAEGGWHLVTDDADPHRFEIHGDGPTHVAVFGGDPDDGFASYPVRENAEFAAHAREAVPALLAEVERLQAERHSTNEALSDAAEALRGREFFLAEYSDGQPSLHSTLAAAQAEVEKAATVDANGRGFEWEEDEDGVHVLTWTDPDDHPMYRTPGSVLPLMVEAGGPR